MDDLEKKVNEKKVESHESFALAQVKSQLIQMQEAYEEMQKANTDQPLPNQNRVFTMLMQALAKARKLLQSLEGLIDSQPSEFITLGKRQRTESA